MMTIVMFKEQEWWVAQCVEYDLAAQGKTLEDAQYAFQRMFCGRLIVARELGIDDPFETVPRAPSSVYKMLSSPNNIFKLEFKLEEFKQEEKLCQNVSPAYMLPKEALLYEAQL